MILFVKYTSIKLIFIIFKLAMMGQAYNSDICHYLIKYKTNIFFIGPPENKNISSTGNPKNDCKQFVAASRQVIIGATQHYSPDFVISSPRDFILLHLYPILHDLILSHVPIIIGARVVVCYWMSSQRHDIIHPSLVY